MKCRSQAHRPYRNRAGRISILPPDRGRSPSAACWPAEADCNKSVILYLTMRCEPGRFAVRRGSVDAPIRSGNVDSLVRRCKWGALISVNMGLPSTLRMILEPDQEKRNNQPGT